jgi:hypothetical protein
MRWGSRAKTKVAVDSAKGDESAQSQAASEASSEKVKELERRLARTDE